MNLDGSDLWRLPGPDPCKEQAIQAQSSQVLSISKDGDSTAPLA